MTLKAGTDGRLECTGHSPVSWTYKVQEYRFRKQLPEWFHHVNITNDFEASPANSNIIYRSSLEFRNISTSMVGKHYCHYISTMNDDSTTEDENFSGSSTYVFVDGTQRLTQ